MIKSGRAPSRSAVRDNELPLVGTVADLAMPLLANVVFRDHVPWLSLFVARLAELVADLFSVYLYICTQRSSMQTVVVCGKWIFCHKYKDDGILDRYKARWVVRAITQHASVDYGKT